MKSTRIPYRFNSPMLATLLAAGLSLGFALTALALDWPQWRGPQRDGISAETAWRTAWPKDGLPCVWKAEVGAGYGSVSVSRGRLYVMGNTADQDSVYCFDAATGKEVWKHTYPCAARDPNGYHGVRSTPTVDGDRVYTTSRQGQLFCLDAVTGKVKWSKDFVRDYGAKPPTWGFALSPLVEGDMLIVEPGAPGAAVVALNKASGQEVWKAGNDPASYSSPIAFDLKGERCVAVFGSPAAAGRNVKDGAEFWRLPWKTMYDINAATPIVEGSRLFLSSGYGVGAAVYDLSASPPAEVWKNKNMRNQVNSCVLWKGFLYGFDESALKCLDFATGKVNWEEKKYGKGSLTLADGKLILYSERGQLGLAEAVPDSYKELAFVKALEVRASYPGGAAKQTWASPVLANGRIYCRSQDDLVCLDVR